MLLVVNAAMRRVHDAVQHDVESSVLPPPLSGVAEAGFVLAGGRLLLARPEHSSPAPVHFEDWEAERWFNKIHLSSGRPADDPAWRGELVGLGLQLARRLLLQASPLTPLPVQATLGLQSAEGEADPEIDFAVGSLHVHVIRAAGDDLRVGIENFAQPVLTLTTAPSTPDLARGRQERT